MLGAIVFALLVWFLVYMSQSHSTSLQLPVQLKTNDFLSPVQIEPSNVTVHITGSGWEIIKFFFSDSKWVVKLDDIAPKVGIEYVLQFKANLIQYLSLSKNADVTVVSVLPAVIHYKLGRRVLKKIPLRLITLPPVSAGLVFSLQPVLTPDSVVIVGASNIVAGLESWDIHVKNDPLTIGQFEIDISLEDSVSSLIDINPKAVKISGNIEPLTEVTIPYIVVQASHLDTGQKVSFIPEKIAVKLVGPASKLALMNSDSIRAVVDYKELISDTTGSVVPTLECSVPIVVKEIFPPSLKYILQN